MDSNTTNNHKCKINAGFKIECIIRTSSIDSTYILPELRRIVILICINDRFLENASENVFFHNLN